jgi:ParB-like chromosome segregation protein Spo0J
MAKKKASAARRAPTDPEIVWRGPDALHALLVPLDKLVQDPANLRSHPERNLAMIRASYRRCGQQKPIVIDKQGVVRAGNGFHLAMTAEGCTHIACVTSDLSGPEMEAYALLDNRTSESSVWDAERLEAALRGFEQSGFDLDADLGFSVADMASLFGSSDWTLPGETPSGEAAGDGTLSIKLTLVFGEVELCSPLKVAVEAMLEQQGWKDRVEVKA